ncbi:hypothetical protein NLX83_34030 [Allokutzneria sp. A3M-2-11 16]|uniref:hypothetical protein n=1 Tax=Allokutzneria sp. A3M-2-11 16 TaxID=2962043 RepID=UPI0020B6EE52|nr:hypothetical protein [Allokutzneria sp. A3M-2-11 16]MCP3804299.1 hypothetical protein [Allokutzneria sp. A3M-2-11 16]
MLQAAYLAGVVTALAATTLSDGEILPPLMGYEQADGRSFQATFFVEAQARNALENNEHEATRAAIVVNGRVPLIPVVKEALLIDIVEYGPVRQRMQLVLPYRDAHSPCGFALHEIGVLDFDNIADADEAPILDAIFAGIESQPAYAELWDKYFENWD